MTTLDLLFDEHEDEDHEPTEKCVNCGKPIVVRKNLFDSACSDACQDELDRLEAATGRCSWCGRHGPFGAICYRKVPGTRELDECGTFR